MLYTVYSIWYIVNTKFFLYSSCPLTLSTALKSAENETIDAPDDRRAVKHPSVACLPCTESVELATPLE